MKRIFLVGVLQKLLAQKLVLISLLIFANRLFCLTLLKIRRGNFGLAETACIIKKSNLTLIFLFPIVVGCERHFVIDQGIELPINLFRMLDVEVGNRFEAFEGDWLVTAITYRDSEPYQLVFIHVTGYGPKYPKNLKDIENGLLGGFLKEFLSDSDYIKLEVSIQ